MYSCLYNLELLILGTGKPSFQSYDEPIQPQTPANYVKQLKGTDVDAIMLCPTAWKLPLWHSKIIPHWEQDAQNVKEPYFTTELKYHEKAYFRLREFMMAGNDPVKTAVDEAKKCSIAPFISYRMNDHHFLDQENAYVHPEFWRKNKNLWLENSGHKSAVKYGRFFNYMKEEVREFYFSLLHELVDLYDVEGLELDFMRSPCYFADEDLEEGRIIMTEFVKRIRNMLNEYGAKRNKRLSLCVRVPLSIEKCMETGLDVVEWDRLKIIDMVNVSSFYISSPYLDINGYKEKIKHSSVYGELHFIVQQGELYNGYSIDISRKTTREIYRAMAADYLDRGADGISVFNMDYTRCHHLNEPRRLHLKDGEPPFDVLCGITDLNNLLSYDKHYFVGSNFSPLPMQDNLDLDIYIADCVENGPFRHALLRLETEKPCMPAPIETTVNGVVVEEIEWLGELFVPMSAECLPRRENVKCYKVPVELLKHGYNKICAKKSPYSLNHANFIAVEIALYHNNSFLGE